MGVGTRVGRSVDGGVLSRVLPLWNSDVNQDVVPISHSAMARNAL